MTRLMGDALLEFNNMYICDAWLARAYHDFYNSALWKQIRLLFNLESLQKVYLATAIVISIIEINFICNNFIYLFLAMLGLPCCQGFLSHLSEQGLLSSCSAQASHCGSFSYGPAQVPGHAGFSSCGTWTQ